MIGKRVRGALYVHCDSSHVLSPPHQERLCAALERAGGVSWNVARIEPAVVALLLYRDFDEDPFPALQRSTRVDLDTGAVSARDFTRAANPLILHRKEELVQADYPGAHRWLALTSNLKSLGLFKDPHLIGRRHAWADRLAAAGIYVEGHRLCRM